MENTKGHLTSLPLALGVPIPWAVAVVAVAVGKVVLLV